jgi:hypothetical protein
MLSLFDHLTTLIHFLTFSIHGLTSSRVGRFTKVSNPILLLSIPATFTLFPMHI